MFVNVPAHNVGLLNEGLVDGAFEITMQGEMIPGKYLRHADRD